METKKEKKAISKIVYIIVLLILAFIVTKLYSAFDKNNFNDFVRTEYILYTSEFTRDNIIKYSKNDSYKIKSDTPNDAMFYKEIEVIPNTPYKVTCMVKTNDVRSKEEISGVGAQIAIEGTTERSVAISGTQEWQKIELIFNSKDREEVNIGFRLGGYLGDVKGEAWFSDFTIEEGMPEQNNDWKFACFIFRTTDVVINQKQVKLEVTRK